MIGIYIHQTAAAPYADDIARRVKTIETRTRDMLGRLVGQRVLLIRTRDGHPADIVGSAVIACKRWRTAAELDAIRDRTRIPAGDRYDCKGLGKWCYDMADAIRFDVPLPLSAFETGHRTRTYAEIK